MGLAQAETKAEIPELAWDCSDDPLCWHRNDQLGPREDFFTVFFLNVFVQLCQASLLALTQNILWWLIVDVQQTLQQWNQHCLFHLGREDIWKVRVCFFASLFFLFQLNSKMQSSPLLDQSFSFVFFSHYLLHILCVCSCHFINILTWNSQS